MAPFSLNKKVFVLFVGSFLFACSFAALPVLAAPPGSPYNAGETLDPSCSPGDTNCTVASSTSDSLWEENGSDIYFSGGSVGIGTSDPDALFHVEGIGLFTDLLTLRKAAGGLLLDVTNGIDSNLDIDISASGALDKYALIAPTTDTRLALGQNSTEYMSIVSGGNVGIGTTEPAYPLDVAGTSGVGINYDNATGHALMRVNGAGSFQAGYYIHKDGSEVAQIAVLGDSPDLSFSMTGTERMRIASGGNVGIGTTTPDNALTVSGAITLSDGSRSVAVGHGVASFSSDASVYGVNSVVGGDRAVALGYTNVANALGGIAIGRFNEAYGDFTVGIGAGNVINGNRSVALGRDNTLTGDFVMGFGDQNVITNASSSVAFGIGNTITASTSIAIGRNIINNLEDSFMFGSSDEGKATLLLNGNLGLGTTTPEHKLVVNGTIGLVDALPTFQSYTNRISFNETLSVPPSETGMVTQFSSGDYGRNLFAITHTGLNTSFFGLDGFLFTMGGELDTDIRFAKGLDYASGDILNSGTELMRIEAASGNVGIGIDNPEFKLHVVGDDGSGNIAKFELPGGTGCIIDTSGVISCTSDRRFKMDIESLDASSTLEKVLALNPVSYHWKTDDASDALKYGFIAQEVEDIFPNLVQTDNKGMKSLSLVGFVPYIVSAVQDIALKIVHMADYFNTKEIQTEKLCVGNTCVTEEQLKDLLDGEEDMVPSSSDSDDDSDEGVSEPVPGIEEPEETPESEPEADEVLEDTLEVEEDLPVDSEAPVVEENESADESSSSSGGGEESPVEA